MSASIQIRQSMFSLIEQWQQSGLSQKAFCEQQGIVTHSFYYWYKRYRLQNDAAGTPAENAFIEIPCESNAHSAGSVELLLAGGHRIIFHQPVSASFLKVLIS